MADSKVNVLITAVDQASGPMGKMQNSFKDWKKVAAGAAVAVGTAMVTAAIQMDNAFKEIIKATGASGEAAEDLQRVFRETAKSVPGDLNSIAIAVGEVNTRLGLTGDQLESASEDFVNFARITNTDVGSAVRGVTRMMGDWGVASSNSQLLLDKLTVASQQTGISIDQLTSVGVNYGVQLRAMGFDLDSSIALLSKFEKEGVSTEKMVAGLSVALGKMAQQGIEDPAEGFRILTERIAEAGSVGDATRIAIETLGSRAGPDFALAVLEGRFAIEDYMGALQNASGTLDETSWNTMTLADNISIAKNNFATFSDALLNPALTAFNKSVFELNTMLQRVEESTNAITAAQENYAARISDLDTAIITSTGIQQEFFEKRREIIELEALAHEAFAKGFKEQAAEYDAVLQGKTDSLFTWMDANSEVLDGVETRANIHNETLKALGLDEAVSRTNSLNQLKVTDAAIRQEIMTTAGILTAEEVKTIVDAKTLEQAERARIDGEIKTNTLAVIEDTKTQALSSWQSLITSLQSKWNASKSGYNAISLTMDIVQRITSSSSGGGSKSVNDAIITPQGDIITTHPKDYIIATKNPGELMGGGSGINITITGNTLLDEDAGEKIGDMIIKRLRPNAAF